MTTPTTPTQLLDRDTAHGVEYELPQPVIRQHFATGQVVEFLNFSPDIYDTLRDFASLGTIPNLDGFTVATTGWASPLNEDGTTSGAPSAHPLRRRVALLVAVTRDSLLSRVYFADDPENPIEDEGEATGSLAEMVLRAGIAVFGDDSHAEALARLIIKGQGNQ